MGESNLVKNLLIFWHPYEKALHLFYHQLGDGHGRPSGDLGPSRPTNPVVIFQNRL